MRYVSQLFHPLLTIPKNAKVKSTEITSKSQKLLLECGFVHPTSSGLFAILPLGRRVLDKLEGLVSSVLESVGAQKISLPALTSSSLWEQTGRLETCATELMTVTDRHQKKYVLSPTHEEAVTDLLADVGPLSYKQLPLILYQMSNKYRDEFRPKHGLLRSREFLMMDAYSLHTDDHCAEKTYCRISDAYQRLFDRLEMTVHRVVAPSGDMGGATSHEWHVLASAGEDRVAVCGACSAAARAQDDVTACTHCGNKTDLFNSIEVGHTFILGTRYSAALGANFTPQTGSAAPLLMSCYGVGLSRLAAACVEVKDSQVLRWPTAMAPYLLCAIGPKEGSKEWSLGGNVTEQVCRKLVQEVPTLAQDVIIDDRHHLTIGKRMMHADRTGYPFIIVCGKSALESPPRYELHLTNKPDLSPQLLNFSETVEVVKKLIPSEELIPAHEIPYERVASQEKCNNL